jgi:hypothetical protein
MTFKELLNEVEHLPLTEKWELVRHVLDTLERDQAPATDEQTDWHQFLLETYGSLKDDPIQRWDQGEYEVREPFE